MPQLFCGVISLFFINSLNLIVFRRAIAANSQKWEERVGKFAVLLVQPRNTLRRYKKADRPSQIECAPCSRCPRAVECLITIHTELKKDPGVPRLPNLKVRSAEKQRRRSVCLPPHRSGACL